MLSNAAGNYFNQDHHCETCFAHIQVKGATIIKIGSNANFRYQAVKEYFFVSQKIFSESKNQTKNKNFLLLGFVAKIVIL